MTTSAKEKTGNVEEIPGGSPAKRKGRIKSIKSQTRRLRVQMRYSSKYVQGKKLQCFGFNLFCHAILYIPTVVGISLLPTIVRGNTVSVLRALSTCNVRFQK